MEVSVKRSVVRVGPSKVHGRGLFMTASVLPGTLLDKGYVLLAPGEEHACDLCDSYSFDNGKAGRCVALGVASLCNHSEEPNAEVVIDPGTGTYAMYAISGIEHGDEVFIDYGEEYWEHHTE